MTLILEDESIDHVCPKTLTRPDAEENIYSCLGSKCMAWRWDRPEGNASPPYGFCGLAGVPAEAEDKRLRS